MVGFDVIRHVAFRALGSFQHQRHVARLGGEFDDVAFLHHVARDRHALAVDLHMAMADELAGGKRCRHELGAIDDRIQTALQQADHVLAGVAVAARGFL